MSALQQLEAEEPETFDILGCGFGPANLAIAVALAEKWAEGQAKPIQRAIFVEKHPEFLWHPGMLIPGSRMQISCLKDLATLRNPASPFTFLAYLHAQHRLAAFINRASTVPTRREFADYLAWAAAAVQRSGVRVAYAEEVLSIARVERSEGGNDQEVIEVVSRQVHTGALVMRRTKHLILSAGGAPRLPPALASLPVPHAPVIHTASYTTSIGPLLARLAVADRPLRVAVVGSGQSATECLLDVHRRLAGLPAPPGGVHEIHMLIRRGSLKPSDDSPFVNEVFDPESTAAFYDLPSDRARKALLAEYKNTNYGVVNPLTLDALYELVYDQKLSDGIAARHHPTTAPATPDGTPRVTIRAYQSVIAATMGAAAGGAVVVTLTCQHALTRAVSETPYDAVVCGTGYDRGAWLRLLRASNLAPAFGLVSGTGTGAGAAKLVPGHYPVSVDDTTDINININSVPESEPEPDVPKFSFVDDAVDPDAESASAPPSSTESSSAPSTPPSSPSLSSVLGHAPRLPAPAPLRISRAYRLLPVSGRGGGRSTSSKGSSRVYLQGCAEATHGLSDTLLSVLGVRAGEVVDDLCEAASEFASELATEPGSGSGLSA